MRNKRNKQRWKMKYRPRFPEGNVFKQLLIMSRWAYFGFPYSGNARFRQYVRARNKLSEAGRH